MYIQQIKTIMVYLTLVKKAIIKKKKEDRLLQEWDFPGVSVVKNPAANAGDTGKIGVQSLGQEGPLEKEMATHSRILAWVIPWTEGPSRPQSTGLQTAQL